MPSAAAASASAFSYKLSWNVTSKLVFKPRVHCNVGSLCVTPIMQGMFCHTGRHLFVCHMHIMHVIIRLKFAANMALYSVWFDEVHGSPSHILRILCPVDTLPHLPPFGGSCFVLELRASSSLHLV